MSQQIHIFDRAVVRRQRERAAGRFAPRHSVVFEDMVAQLLDRLGDVKRAFPSILDLGGHDGFLAKRLAERAGAFVVTADLSDAMLRRGAHPVRVAMDEELLPFAAGSFDLVISNLSLHWVNDLPGTLAQIKKTLRPDGLFLAALLGGRTLQELRQCLLEAELAVTGGVSPRLSPSLDTQTASALLQRAGFSLPVTDQETITLTYPDLLTLMRDVRGMGEGNAQVERSKKFLRREIITLADRFYRERFSRADGRLTATFEAVFMHGWA